jgi:hypothetical protein
LLSRRAEIASPSAMAAHERERISLEEAELASAGLVGIEGERTPPPPSSAGAKVGSGA